MLRHHPQQQQQQQVGPPGVLAQSSYYWPEANAVAGMGGSTIELYMVRWLCV